MADLSYEVVVERGASVGLDASPYQWGSIQTPTLAHVVAIDATTLAFSGHTIGREILSAQLLGTDSNWYTGEVALNVIEGGYNPTRLHNNVLEAVYAKDATRPISITPFAMTRVLGARFVDVSVPSGVEVVDLRDHVALLRWSNPSGMVSVTFSLAVPGLPTVATIPFTLRAGAGRRHYVGGPILSRRFTLPAGRIAEIPIASVHPDAIDILRVTEAELPVGYDRERGVLLVEMPEGGTGGHIEVFARTKLGIVPVAFVVQPV